MKTIRVKRNTGAHLPAFTEGQVVDVPDHTAHLLCGLHLAEVLQAIPDEPILAIPANPTVMAVDVQVEQTHPLPQIKRSKKPQTELKE